MHSLALVTHIYFAIALLLSIAPGAISSSSSSSSSCGPGSSRPIAIVTGGTRGVGSGIARALADDGYDLLLAYNSDRKRADEFAELLLAEHKGGELRVKCVGGDISLCSTRDKIFATLDSMLLEEEEEEEGRQRRRLAVLVHNAGQYVGITSENSAGLEAGERTLSFGDGSLVDGEGRVDFETMHYYQRMYGEAFVDLCERSLLRMGSGGGGRGEDGDGGGGGGGSIVGISSPGVNAHYYGPDWSYSMPGSGKSLMEYSMRVYAARVAERGINVNVIVPGVTKTEAWGRVATSRGLDDERKMMEGIVERRVPLKRMLLPSDVGNAVKFLCSESGKFLTGTVIPLDGGMHLK